MSDKLKIYTDGACSGNPGIGGWGAVLINANTGEEKYLSGAENVTTNNKMELTATIESLKSINKPSEIELYTDSQYVNNGINIWINNWKNNGWKTEQKARSKQRTMD